MGKTKIVVKETKNKQKVVTLVGGNGEKLMHSENLKSSTAVKKNIAAVKKAAPKAVVIDETKKVPAKVTKKVSKK